MIKELSYKIIYDDFVYKTQLTDDENKVLDMLIKKYSITKISRELCICERNVSRCIRQLKDKYKIYKELEIVKLNIFNNQI